MGTSFDRSEESPYGRVTDATPVVSGRFWRGVRNGLIASAFGWGVIIGLGYLGYRIGQMI